MDMSYNNKKETNYMSYNKSNYIMRLSVYYTEWYIRGVL